MGSGRYSLFNWKLREWAYYYDYYGYTVPLTARHRPNTESPCNPLEIAPTPWRSPPVLGVGPSEITAHLDVGGMGEVYVATDARLKRNVAVKVLPEMFATHPRRLARFQREAQVLVALNHPNIAHVYGLEQ